jgi:hypothetical protein
VVGIWAGYGKNTIVVKTPVKKKANLEFLRLALGLLFSSIFQKQKNLQI